MRLQTVLNRNVSSFLARSWTPCVRKSREWPSGRGWFTETSLIGPKKPDARWVNCDKAVRAYRYQCDCKRFYCVNSKEHIYKYKILYVLLTLRLNIILEWPTWYTLALFYNTFIIILYMFRALYAHHQEGELYWCSSGIVKLQTN